MLTLCDWQCMNVNEVSKACFTLQQLYLFNLLVFPVYKKQVVIDILMYYSSLHIPIVYHLLPLYIYYNYIPIVNETFIIGI